MLEHIALLAEVACGDILHLVEDQPAGPGADDIGLAGLVRELA
jgi:hypothetical protein